MKFLAQTQFTLNPHQPHIPHNLIDKNINKKYQILAQTQFNLIHLKQKYHITQTKKTEKRGLKKIKFCHKSNST